MRVILIGPALEENLSVAYLCSVIRAAGHECSILPFNRAGEIRAVARKVLRRDPDVVGLSLVAQRRYDDFQTLVALLRARGLRGHVTAGGHFASLRAAEVLRDTPGIDTILHHDGELRLLGLLHLLSAGEAVPGSLDGVSWRERDGSVAHVPPTTVAALDALPFPARRRPDRTLGYARAPLVTSRGCSGSCSFCSIHAWHAQVPRGRLRFRSPANVAEEMISLHRERGVRVFVFHDDDFIHPDRRTARQRCARILEAAERGIGEPLAFVIKCRPDDVEEELFRYLRSKGLARAYVGIETHAASGLAALNRRVSPETNLRALRILAEAGVYACFNLLIFHPETTLEELRRNLAFLRAHCDHPFDVARTELYARSTLEQRMVREGRALGDYRGFGYRILDPRAESAFQLFSTLLWDRHFGGHSVLHRAQDLGFRHALLRRFHPELAPAELGLRVGRLIREVNAATVDHLDRIADLAARPAATESLKREIASRTRSQTLHWASLSLELETRAALGRAGLSRWPSADRLPRLLGRAATAIPCIGLLLGPLSCSDQSAVCDPPPPPVRFSTDIEPVLNQTCATTGCHAAGSAHAGLVLATGVSRANIVDVPSTEVPRLDRIEPGAADSSYLIAKLRGTQLAVGGSGERMPKGGAPAAQLQTDLERWTEDGAPGN
jgi:anaerobic magnesium-protoporphyrin IX monomethyl ester cyclase